MSKDSYSYDSLKNKWRLAGISLLEFFGLIIIGFLVAMYWYSQMDNTTTPNTIFMMVIVGIIGVTIISILYHYILRVPTTLNYYLGLNKYRDVVLHNRDSSYRF